jgi:hypothetical protein
MSKQKRLSKLALAGAGLLAASVSCFAQTESVKSQNESTSPVTVATSKQFKLDERLNSYGIPDKAIEKVDVPNTQKNFSAEKFMTAVKQSSNTSLGFLTTPSYEPRKDENAKSVAPKRIEFVPSVGQKLPE